MNSVDKSFKNNKDFYIIFALILLLFCLSINTDLAEFSQHRDIRIPANFFYYTLGVDVLVLISWVLLIFYKKAGVILFPLLVFIHFGLHNYFLSTYLYSDITVLFMYIGLGLFALIPRWNVLK
ncbi:hypothetical protein SAMN05660493_02279 [Epilithonimonas bovis DSM 19482]|uniref:DoxX-like family protein n=1 Tax=Epilithonimonas bovis DSM 19482 TaxID=1121284 RepID=A0A1U7PXE1_9FLAO|nr:hypothetical protein SAMN05660493_02279 [Epilithonimonas bovis DSM 19482]HBR10999.1 hypothetical protein [Chryseobacterium sp.]